MASRIILGSFLWYTRLLWQVTLAKDLPNSLAEFFLELNWYQRCLHPTFLPSISPSLGVWQLSSLLQLPPHFLSQAFPPINSLFLSWCPLLRVPRLTLCSFRVSLKIRGLFCHSHLQPNTGIKLQRRCLGMKADQPLVKEKLHQKEFNSQGRLFSRLLQ